MAIDNCSGCQQVQRELEKLRERELGRLRKDTDEYPNLQHCKSCKNLGTDIAYLRNVIRDCLILAGCEPSQPRAERKIHGIDFVTSILDALRSAYDATNQYGDAHKEEVESVIREKIRLEMNKSNMKQGTPDGE